MHKEGSKKVIYQIFPRSFYDANNDGSGDLAGITAKLSYLAKLGIDAIGLCPIYTTPFVDGGYDVTNYEAIWAQFGTMTDFEKLVTQAQKLGIEIIMDIVLNHVSSEHHWFKKACTSPKNPEHHYFIGREKLSPAEKVAESIFGGSAGEYVPHLKKYYFHLFAKDQVDLNWDNETTIQAVADTVKFGYKKGVKAFRFDAIKHISKSFPEGNSNSFAGGPTVVKNLQKLEKMVRTEAPDVFIIGEASGITTQELVEYGQGPRKVANSYFNFSWGAIGWGKTGRNGYDAAGNPDNFVDQMHEYQENPVIKPDMMVNFLSNHDTSRAVSRWGDTRVFWEESAKCLALLLFSVKGIPCVYFGDEIGMINPGFKNRSELQDVDALNAYDVYVKGDHTYTETEMTKYHSINGRDNCRIPMRWDSSPNNGFNNGKKPGIKTPYEATICVAQQLDKPTSILSFYQELIKLRKDSPFANTLVAGTSKMNLLPNGVFQIVRQTTTQKIVVFINLGQVPKTYEPGDYQQVIIRSGADQKPVNQELRAYEAIMFLTH